MIDFVKIPEEKLRMLRRDRRLIQRLEKSTDVNVELDDGVSIEAEDPLVAMNVKNVIKAFGRGFDFDDAMNLLDEDYFLDIIEISGFSGRSKNRMGALKGRVIGTDGKTKRLIEQFTECKVAIHGKTISIIGKAEKVKIAREAVEMLLSGRLHSSVYRFLEKQKW